MKRIVLLCVSGFLVACSGRGDVDLSKATPLTGEPVANGPAAGQDPNPGTPHGLFSLPVGKWTSFQVLGGVIDPVGTVIEQDFDGDGIDNSKETTSNIWVADYPVIESQIAPPVTMRIEVLKTDKSDTSTINTDLTSDNFESRKNEGSEKFHQDEVNLRTINNGSTTDTSSSTTVKEAKVEASGSFFDIGVKASAGITNTESSSNTTVRQTFEDRPFVNNIDRAAQSVKSDAAEKKARDYRAEKRQKKDEDYLTKPDGGIIRAALYIKNQSVNMPVKLSNILCSLVFETPSGGLIPIQSFRLRNDDFSLFEVEVYGGSEFGPYVVTLSGLNTVEVENALAYGYTPKIFIVDYKMTHVQDSNYRTSLGSNFSGDNLKIIEENAKGRTALVKLMYPSYRNMFRIVAFDTKLTTTGTDICNPADIEVSSATSVSPGIHMDKFLNRLKCSGVEIEYGHYIYDFTGLPQAVKYPKVYTYTVKSVNGVGVTAPCSATTAGVGFNPATRQYEQVSDVCLIKIADLTEEQLNSLSLWATFSNGKYYRTGEIATRADGSPITYDNQSLSGCGKSGLTCGIPVFKGVNSYVWAGDNYDLVYLRMSDYLSRLDRFGVNPLETGAKINFNTAWSAKDLGEYPWYPQVRATYLGQAGVGDTIEVKVKLNDTTYLGPNFGTPATDSLGGLAFTDFQYDTRKETAKLFNVREAIDFELNLGLGGEKADWVNLIRDTNTGTAAHSTLVTNCGQSWNFLQQEFTFCLILPSAPTGVGSERVVNLYLRTSLNNAYRKTIWPQDWRKIRKFDSTLKGIVNIDSDSTTLDVENVIGNASDVATGNTITVGSSTKVYAISAMPVGTPSETPAGSGIYRIVIKPALDSTEVHSVGERVYVRATSTEIPGPQLSLRIDNGFETAWNSVNTQVNPTTGLGMLLTGAYAASNCATNAGWRANHCLGYNQDHQTSNWMGYDGFNNVQNDAQNLSLARIAKVLMEKFSLPSGQQFRRYLYFADDQTPFSTNSSGSQLISAHNSGEQYFPKVVLGSTRALVVWHTNHNSSNFEIWGRFIDLISGLPEGDDFPISDLNSGDNKFPSATISNDIALIVWTSGASGSSNIVGQIVNLVTKDIGFASAPGAFTISIRNGGQQEWPVVKPYGNRSAFILWSSNDTGIDFDVRGRGLDFSGSNPSFTSVDDLFINNTLVGNQGQADIAINGDTALLCWAGRESTNDDNVRGRVLDLSTGQFRGPDFLLAISNARTESNPHPVIVGESGIIFWNQGEDYFTDKEDIRGRSIDLEHGIPLTTQEIQVSGGPSGSYQRLAPLGYSIVVQGNYAFLTWESLEAGASYWDVKGQIVDITRGAKIFSNDLTISPPSTVSQSSPRVALSGNRAIISWIVYSGTTWQIRGRAFDVFSHSFGRIQDVELSEAAASVPQGAYIAANGKTSMLFWSSNAGATGDDIRGRALTFEKNPMASDTFGISDMKFGLNNFFTAPLIERNYTVTSRIKF